MLSSTFLGIIAWIAPVLDDWLWVANNSPSVSSSRWPCWSHIQVLLVTTLSICLKNCPWSSFPHNPQLFCQLSPFSSNGRCFPDLHTFCLSLPPTTPLDYKQCSKKDPILSVRRSPQRSTKLSHISFSARALYTVDVRDFLIFPLSSFNSSLVQSMNWCCRVHVSKNWHCTHINPIYNTYHTYLVLWLRVISRVGWNTFKFCYLAFNFINFHFKQPSITSNSHSCSQKQASISDSLFQLESDPWDRFPSSPCSSWIMTLFWLQFPRNLAGWGTWPMCSLFPLSSH